MPYQSLLSIDKPFFSKEDVTQALDISPNSAGVLCSRYVKRGLLTRLKRDLYVRTETLRSSGQNDLFKIANFLQVPSYISLMTALSYYGITTQVQRDIFESISIKRTKAYDRGGFSFRYTKINPKLYGKFKKDKEVFIATPEKAVLDSFYLASMGRYALDLPSLDLGKLNANLMAELSHIYPSRTVKYLERHYEKIGRT